MLLEQQLVRLEEHAANSLVAAMWAAGPVDILQRHKTAFFCSSQCPGSVILKTFDLITAWRNENRILAGGFHSPMEQECLSILVRGRQPVIWMPARSIAGMHLRSGLQPAFNDRRLLLLSPFEPKQKRITAALAEERNRFLAAIADYIFVAHAAAGSRTMQLCQKLAEQSKLLLTIDDAANRPLIDLGAKPVTSLSVAGIAGIEQPRSCRDATTLDES